MHTHNLLIHNLLTHKLHIHNILAAVGVADVTLGDIHLRFTWQAWYLMTLTSTLVWQAWHLWHQGRRGCWRGSRGTWSWFHVAGVVFGDIDFHFAGQAWHLWYWAGSGGALGFRRGAGDAAAVGVAGMALGDIHLGFMWRAWYLVISTSSLVWQAWHLWHWAGSGGALGFRRGAGDAAAVGVAGVTFGDIHLRFTWQAWYLVTSISSLAWQAWHLWHWAGSAGALGFRRGGGDAAAVGVAAVALGVIHLDFTWQVWHFVTSTFTLCGRRGTYGTGLALVARLVLGVAPGAPRLLAWQPWHLETSTLFSCGRRRTWWHRLPLRVTGVALGCTHMSCTPTSRTYGSSHEALGTPRRLVWQAWHLETSTFVLRGRRGIW